MSNDELKRKLTSRISSVPSWDFKIAMSIALVAACINSLRVAYNAGYLYCRKSSEYLACLGILGDHGSFLVYLNSVRLQIAISLFVVVIGLWGKRVIGFAVSFLALAYLGKTYLWWHYVTLADMRELEVPDFAQLQGPDYQHLVVLRYAGWWDLVVLTIAIVLFVWQTKTVVRALRLSHVEPHI